MITLNWLFWELCKEGVFVRIYFLFADGKRAEDRKKSWEMRVKGKALCRIGPTRENNIECKSQSWEPDLGFTLLGIRHSTWVKTTHLSLVAFSHMEMNTYLCYSTLNLS